MTAGNHEQTIAALPVDGITCVTGFEQDNAATRKMQ